MDKIQFKFYVLNYDFRKKCIVNYNVFNNIRVNEWTEKSVKKYLANPKKYCNHEKTLCGFEALCDEIESIILNQQWSRREYEISVADAFITDISELEKWDVYQQCKPNIPIITRECIYQYKQYSKGGYKE